MKRRRHIRVPLVLMMALALLAATGCKKEKEHLNVPDSSVQGLWVKSGTQEYWRYNSDHTGVTWDESDDISESESNLRYTWEIRGGDELMMVSSGEMGNQFVPKTYTITEINSTTMKWESYGMEYTLKKR